MPRPLPYPYARLRRMSRGEAARRSRVARRLDLGELDRAASSAAALFGAAPAIHPEPVGICPAAMVDRVVPERCAAVVIASAADPLRRRFVLELGSAAARGLVDRLVGVEATHVEAPLSQGELGVLLYGAARLLADAGGDDFQVVAALTTRVAFREAMGAGDLTFWPVRFELAGAFGVARIWLSDELLARAPLLRPPAGLADVPLPLRLVRGHARVASRELAVLAPGDALVLDEATAPNELFAEVPGSRRARLRCRLDAGRVVVQEILPGHDAGARTEGRASASPSTAGVAMSEAATAGRDPLTDGLARAGDAEVELTVDVARLRIRLAELARLRPGEVLGTAVEVGANVRLRAGELDVAEGELVDVEGKLGVLVTTVFPTAPGGARPGDQ